MYRKREAETTGTIMVCVSLIEAQDHLELGELVA